ncbi:unnamed protein product [Meloidogyne enterolobii]|uniref:Uncharacterized protein n=1 Tax=Meloidogyne enterolobii TaxID=390850 RepID=A0ACB0YBM9_MELEN
MIFNKIRDSKDFEKENFDNYLKEENEDNKVYKKYIQDLHKKVLKINVFKSPPLHRISACPSIPCVVIYLIVLVTVPYYGGIFW